MRRLTTHAIDKSDSPPMYGNDMWSQRKRGGIRVMNPSIPICLPGFVGILLFSARLTKICCN